MIRLFFINFLFLYSLVASAGWSSGGGELLKDAENPWFLENTPQVQYCIKIDETNFGQTEVFVEETVQRAFQYWKEQFSAAISPTHPNIGVIRFASNFLQVECNDNVPLVFQFGVLTKAQKEYLRDPTQYAAISVRTEYDPIYLRTKKGFVYVSPTHGPLKFDNKGGEYVENAWRVGDGGLLEKIIIHEIGHIFGIPHHGQDFELMSVGFAESILSKDRAHAYSFRAFTSNVFKLGSSKSTSCAKPSLGRVVKKFFSIPDTWQCYEIKLENVKPFEDTLVKIFASKTSSENPDEPMTLMGKATIKIIGSFTPIEMVRVKLNPLQMVFPLGDNSSPYLVSVIAAEVRKKGMYKSAHNAEEKELFVTLRPNYLELGGMLDNKYYPNLVWGSN